MKNLNELEADVSQLLTTVPHFNIYFLREIKT